MKRRMVTIASALILCFALSAAALAGGGEASLLLGQRVLSDDEFEEADSDSGFQFGVAVSLDFDWPVWLALDLLSSSDDETQDLSGAFPYQVSTDVDTLEFDVGVRKFFLEDTSWRPYVGGGLAWVQLEVQQVESGSFGPGTEYSSTVVDDDDGSAGYWLNGGVLYRIGRFHVGVDLRWSDASADLMPSGATSEVGVDSGGVQYALAGGFHW